MPRPRIKLKEEALTVRDALELASFEGSKVVTGAKGLSRRISGAMVMEATDIQRWGREGIFLVTSFFALEPLNEQERYSFLAELVKIKPSGVAFKPGRLLDEAPEDVVDCCTASNIPLIELSPTTKYESVLTDVMSSALDSNLMLLTRFYSIHRQTMKLALKQPSLFSILEEAKKTIGLDCSYYDKTSGTCMSTSPRETGITNLHLTELHRGHYQTFHYYNAKFDTSTESDEQALAVLIPTSDGIPSYLLVHTTADRDLSPLDIMAIESFVSLLQMELLKEGAIEERVFRRSNTLVHDLLLGRYSTKSAVDDALRELALGNNPFYQTLLVRFHIVDAKQSARLSELLLTFRRQLKQQHFNVTYFENNNRMVFLRSFSTETQALQPEVIRQILDNMSANQDLPTFTYLATLSGTVDRYNIARANDQVMGVYRLFDPDRKHNYVLHYDDLGIYKIFLNVEDHDKLVEFMNPSLRTLWQENPQVFGTLLTLVDNDLNFARTAEELFVHYKTVSYRVNRAREAYGIDVHDSDTLAQLVIARRILTLMGEDIPQ